MGFRDATLKKLTRSNRPKAGVILRLFGFAYVHVNVRVRSFAVPLGVQLFHQALFSSQLD